MKCNIQQQKNAHPKDNHTDSDGMQQPHAAYSSHKLIVQ